MESYIDPIYKKYVASIEKALASSEFYEYYMSMIAAGKTNYQFTNRRLEKQVDETWVKAIEAVIKPMQEIINKPRNFIRQDEVISNIALVKKISPESIRHLSNHGSMVDNYDAKTNTVRPNRMMEFMKEDTWNTYENKFVYTLLEMAYDFVDKRYEGIFAALDDEFGSNLTMSMVANSASEKVSIDTGMKIQVQEDYLSNDNKNNDIFSRIARLHRILGEFRQSNFAKTVAKFGKIKPPLVRTNAIAKHPNFKACHKLWDFILMYKDVGYSINIYEQSTEIDDDFLKDIYHNILINYVILKNHLEQKKDRLIDSNKPFRKKAVIPHFNKEIVEEIVDNYDLPDVEVHKILNEDITMEKLMEAEHAERVRLVKEKEEADRKRREAEEAERIRRQKAEEQERIRREKEEAREAERLERERLRVLAQEAEEKARIEKMQADFFASVRAAADAVLNGRDAVVAKLAAEKEAIAKAALEQAERERKAALKAEAERKAAEKKAEEERLAKEKQEKLEQLKQEEERRAAVAEADRQKAEAEKKKKQEMLQAQSEKAKQRALDKQEANKRAAEAIAEEKRELARLNSNGKMVSDSASAVKADAAAEETVQQPEKAAEQAVQPENEREAVDNRPDAVPQEQTVQQSSAAPVADAEVSAAAPEEQATDAASEEVVTPVDTTDAVQAADVTVDEGTEDDEDAVDEADDEDDADDTDAADEPDTDELPDYVKKMGRKKKKAWRAMHRKQTESAQAAEQQNDAVTNETPTNDAAPVPVAQEPEVQEEKPVRRGLFHRR